MWKDNLCKHALENGGSISPLIIPELNGGLALCNPSVFNDDGNLVINVRGVNYTLHHSENEKKFQTPWGPVNYVRPDNNARLETTNFFCELDENLHIKNPAKIDTSKHDITPVWEFTGLEDARVVKWDGRMFLCGGRRDVKDNGEGRIEFTEIEMQDGIPVEINRFRIQPPVTDYSYLEKNWMPINDIPFHFVRWANPTEVVRVNLETLSSEIVYKSMTKTKLPREVRGSSSVVTVGDYRVAITHETDFWRNRQNNRDVIYYHRFIIWDKDWNIVKISDTFKFMQADVEFCAGMCEYNGSLLITFGYMDNAAYVLNLPVDMFFKFMEEEFNTKNYESIHGYKFPDSKYKKSNNEDLRFKFKGLENITNNYSDSYQDMFVLSMLDGKKYGTYLEIGAAEGYFHNNTALLEDVFGWNGASIEIDEDMVEDFRANRGNEVIHANALELDYEDVLSRRFGDIIDYLQVDCEPAEVTFEILKKIPFDKYKFRVITYEHDAYVAGDKFRQESRKYLESLGYKLVVDNISPHFSEDKPFEDWWVHPDLVNDDILEKMMCVDNKTKNAKRYMNGAY